MSLQSAFLPAFEEPEKAEVMVEKPKVQKTDPIKPIASTVTITQKYGVTSSQNGSTVTTYAPIQKPKEEIKVPDVKVGDEVKHNTFGIGTVVYMDKAQKKLRVKFSVGEKTFVYPYAFIQGFLKF